MINAAVRAPPGPPRRGRETVRITTAIWWSWPSRGQIAHPVGRANPYRIGNDGVPRVLPASGGIAVNQRIGDRCVGLAGDHIEPGVSLHNNRREVVGPRSGPNDALITYACVGNRARVISGPCTGQWGLVTGKHGGINHVMVDFPTPVLRRLQIGDRIQVYSCGLGLRLGDYPEVAVFNCAPAWGILEDGGTLSVPVTHLVPRGSWARASARTPCGAGTTISSSSMRRLAGATGSAACGTATWSPSSTVMPASGTPSAARG